MSDCIANMRQSDELGKSFINALDAWEWLRDNNWIGTLNGIKMNYDNKIKFCRWVNGSRCPNLITILSPT